MTLSDTWFATSHIGFGLSVVNSLMRSDLFMMVLLATGVRLNPYTIAGRMSRDLRELQEPWTKGAPEKSGEKRDVHKQIGNFF